MTAPDFCRGPVFLLLLASCSTTSHETKRGELISSRAVSSKVEYEMPAIVEVDAGVARLKYERRLCTESADEYRQVDVEQTVGPHSNAIASAAAIGVGATCLTIGAVFWSLSPTKDPFESTDHAAGVGAVLGVGGTLVTGLGLAFLALAANLGVLTETTTKEFPLASTETIPGRRCDDERAIRRGVLKWELSGGDHRVRGETASSGEFPVGDGMRLFLQSMSPFDAVAFVRQPPAIFLRLGNAPPFQLSNLDFAGVRGWAKCIESAAAAARNTCNQRCSSTIEEAGACGENMSLCIEVAENETDRDLCNERFDECVAEKAPDKRALAGCTSTCVATEMKTRCKL